MHDLAGDPWPQWSKKPALEAKSRGTKSSAHSWTIIMLNSMTVILEGKGKKHYVLNNEGLKFTWDLAPATMLESPPSLRGAGRRQHFFFIVYLMAPQLISKSEKPFCHAKHERWSQQQTYLFFSCENVGLLPSLSQVPSTGIDLWLS